MNGERRRGKHGKKVSARSLCVRRFHRLPNKRIQIKQTIKTIQPPVSALVLGDSLSDWNYGNARIVLPSPIVAHSTFDELSSAERGALSTRFTTGSVCATKINERVRDTAKDYQKRTARERLRFSIARNVSASSIKRRLFKYLGSCPGNGANRMRWNGVPGKVLALRIERRNPEKHKMQ